jgi:hypothetical protein
MRYVLGPAGGRAIRQVLRSRPLVAFDYDGTLAPIVSDPAEAGMRAATRDLLTRLAGRCVCVVVSGRARRDLLSRLAGVGVTEAIGNHGIEPWATTPRAVRIVRKWHGQLDARLARLDGVIVEDKTDSISIHYRRARERKKAGSAVGEAVAAWTGAADWGSGASASCRLRDKGWPSRGPRAVGRHRAVVGDDRRGCLRSRPPRTPAHHPGASEAGVGRGVLHPKPGRD